MNKAIQKLEKNGQSNLKQKEKENLLLKLLMEQSGQAKTTALIYNFWN